MTSFETNDLNFKKSSQKEIHIKARTESPSIYPKRFEVPDEKVSWEINYPEYNPKYFVAPTVLENDYTKKEDGWADTEEIPKNKISEWINKKINIDSNARPLNPYGRTGICGRGLLGRWGENPAADPIVTRINPNNQEIELLVIQRKDSKEIALPGGMVDREEDVIETLHRELWEETGIDLKKENISFKNGDLIYDGYVDDRRNTDNAWMNTTAVHLHIPNEIIDKLVPIAGDDAQDAFWLPLTKESIDNFYANHGELIIKTLEKFYNDKKDSLDSNIKKQIEEILEKDK